MPTTELVSEIIAMSQSVTALIVSSILNDSLQTRQLMNAGHPELVNF